MQRSILSIGVLALAVFAVRAAEDAEKVSIRGDITAVNAAPKNDRGLLGSIRVEGEKAKDTEYDKASVRITDKTKIHKMVGKEKKEATFEDLKKGSKVQAVFTGPVAESYPVQAAAKEVVILEEAKK